MSLCKDTDDEEEIILVVEGVEDEEGDDSEGGRGAEELRMVLLGKTGSGKSACGNTILGRKQFLSQISASSVTQVCESGSAELCEEEGQPVACRKVKRVTVVDMPGFGDTQLSLEQVQIEIAKCVALSTPGPHAFLLVVPIGRYTDNENQALCEMTTIFGEDAVRHHTVVLFSRGDDLGDIGIEEYLSNTAPAGLKTLIGRCGSRYHVFNNRDASNSAQVKGLLMKVDKMVKQSSRGFYTNALFLAAQADKMRMMMRERGEAEGEEDGKNNSSEEEQAQHSNRRRRHSRENSDRALRRIINRQQRAISVLRRANERQQAAISELQRTITRQPRGGHPRGVLETIGTVAASAATGLAVGAMFGAAVPFVASGAFTVGNVVGSNLAGMSVAGGMNMGAVMSTWRTGATLGAVTGVILGGGAGFNAASPGEGALDAFERVFDTGRSVAMVAASVGGTLGLQAPLGPVTGTAAMAVVERAVHAVTSRTRRRLPRAAGRHALL